MTALANHFPVPGTAAGQKQTFIRDSEGLERSRHKKWREAAAVAAKAKRKRPEVVEQQRTPGDLSGCPRWQALRTRVVFFEDLAKAGCEEDGHSNCEQ